MKLKNFILLGVFLLGLLVCGNSSVVLAKEDGTEECDAVTVEQARAITASATFLSEVKPTLDDIKKVVEELVVEQGKEFARISQDVAEMNRKEYDEAIRRYWAKSGQPKLK